MDYYLLTEVATDLGYELARSGAETFRVEESISRVLATYGIQSEVFAIPNCLHVSFETDRGKPVTRMRRIGYHGTNLEAVERFNALSRRICAEKPDPETAHQWLQETRTSIRTFSVPAYLFAHFLGSFGFALFFKGSLIDALWAGVCGFVVYYVSRLMDDLKTNPFFATIASSFCMALVAYAIAALGWTPNVDTVIIGTLMILVPGLLFTNSMRDIIFGDTNSGINRLVQVILIGVAIALGVAAAWQTVGAFCTLPAVAPLIEYSFWIQIFVSFIGCIGFAMYWNVHSWGIPLCALGGMITWAAYLIALKLGCDILGANFWATIVAAIYSEVMARIRKFPAITYLVVSLFPLLPGAGIYYTTAAILQKNTELAYAKGSETAGIAGVMAVGILLVSTVVKLYYTLKNQHHHNVQH